MKEDFYDSFVPKLDLPQEIINEIVKLDECFLLCLCGEQLEWRYVDSLSNRLYEYEDDFGWHITKLDVLCVFCKYCKRYTGLIRETNSKHPSDYHEYCWFYLPRFPKQTELINEEELEKKPPIWEKRIDDH